MPQRWTIKIEIQVADFILWFRLHTQKYLDNMNLCFIYDKDTLPCAIFTLPSQCFADVDRRGLISFNELPDEVKKGLYYLVALFKKRSRENLIDQHLAD